MTGCRLQFLGDGPEHFADLFCQVVRLRYLRRIAEAKITRNDELSLDFKNRTTRNPEKIAVISPGSASRALRDVARD